jgi:hypothetical protein
LGTFNLHGPVDQFLVGNFDNNTEGKEEVLIIQRTSV